MVFDPQLVIRVDWYGIRSKILALESDLQATLYASILFWSRGFQDERAGRLGSREWIIINRYFRQSRPFILRHATPIIYRLFDCAREDSRETRRGEERPKRPVRLALTLFNFNRTLLASFTFAHITSPRIYVYPSETLCVHTKATRT